MQRQAGRTFPAHTNEQFCCGVGGKIKPEKMGSSRVERATIDTIYDCTPTMGKLSKSSWSGGGS